MFRPVVAAAVMLAACSQTDNDRPRTLQYVTEAILQPNCAQDVCHSSYTRVKGYAFDTVAAARASLQLTGMVNKVDPESSLIYTVLTRTLKRMPYDAPLPDKDVEVIHEWLTTGVAAKELGL